MAESNIKRQKVESSNIAEIGYDNSKRILEISFKNGSVYQYTPVTEEAYKQCMAASSKGKWVHSNLKGNDMIDCKRIS